MEIKVDYSKDEDISTVKEILSKADFYNRNNYKVCLPKGLNLNCQYSDITADIIDTEYAEKEPSYRAVENEIQTSWKINKENILSFFSLLDYDLPEKVVVHLISYGPGGGYSLPNQVAILVEKKSRNTYLELLLHEIIHLLFEESIVKKYRLNQLEKENLVESMFTHPKLKKLFPEHSFPLSFLMPNKSLLKKVEWRQTQ